MFTVNDRLELLMNYLKGAKLVVIRQIREATGYDLKEAKVVADQFMPPPDCKITAPIEDVIEFSSTEELLLKALADKSSTKVDERTIEAARVANEAQQHTITDLKETISLLRETEHRTTDQLDEEYNDRQEAEEALSDAMSEVKNLERRIDAIRLILDD